MVVLATPYEILAQTTDSNTVQTLAILQAPVNSDLHGDSGDSLLVEGQALMNDKRPSSDLSNDSLDSSSDQISIYIVRNGDTVAGVAKMFGVSENTVRWANNLGSKSSLTKDQELVILPISGVKYIVKKGDTIKSIATSFNADQDEILSFNDFRNGSDLKIGDEIIIPNGEIGVSASTKSKKVASSKNLPLSKSSSGGYLTRPVKGGIRTQGIHGHNGVDLANKLNSPIIAAAGGKVIIAKQGGWNGGYGSYVVISHPNGMQTLYGHMNSLNVSTGQTVGQGEIIGRMGSTGQSTGVHLHFEVRGGTNPF